VSDDRNAPAAQTGLFSAVVALERLAPLLIEQLATDRQSQKVLVWADGDSEVAVFPAELKLALRPGLLLIELPMAADQTGRAPLLFAFQVGTEPADATLLAVTEDLPRGDATLAARWGRIGQEILWEALLRAGAARGGEARANVSVQLAGLYVPSEKTVIFLFSRPISAAEVRDYYAKRPPPDRPRVGRIPALSSLRRKPRPPRG
jgi:hypothetical protein